MISENLTPYKVATAAHELCSNSEKTRMDERLAGLQPRQPLIDLETSTQPLQADENPRPQQGADRHGHQEQQGRRAVAGQGIEPELDQLAEPENDQQNHALLPEREHPQPLLQTQHQKNDQQQRQPVLAEDRKSVV